MDTVETLRQWPTTRLGAFTVPPDVIIDNTASEALTVVEVHAIDRPGLLFNLTREFRNLGLDIASAHIATFGEKAVDVFYVTDRSRQKITGQSAISHIQQKLLEMLNRD
jgi:[protein-PII] uridylyltransferase